MVTGRALVRVRVLARATKPAWGPARNSRRCFRPSRRRRRPGRAPAGRCRPGGVRWVACSSCAGRGTPVSRRHRWGRCPVRAGPGGVGPIAACSPARLVSNDFKDPARGLPGRGASRAAIVASVLRPRPFCVVVPRFSRIQFSPRLSGSRRHGTIHPVKRARPPLAQPPKGRAGGRSGLHRATQQLTAVRRVPQGTKARIRATETSRFSSGETGNLCVQQHQVGGRRPGPGSPRVDGIEPCWRQPAQTNGGHGARARKGTRDAQNPAYRPASHIHARHAWTAGCQRAALPDES